MGQSCGCSDKEQAARIKELQLLLAQEKDDLVATQQEYAKIVASTASMLDQKDNSKTKAKAKVNKIMEEKKQIFNAMLKAKNEITKLQKQLDGYQSKKTDMMKQIKQYEASIAEYEQSDISILESKDDSLSSSNIKQTPPSSVSGSPRKSVNSVNPNISDDVSTISSWLNSSSIDRKSFNKKIIDLFLHRKNNYRYELKQKYFDKFNNKLIDDILVNKLDNKCTSIPYFIISSLLMKSAEIDCVYIHSEILNKNIERVAHVMCTRNINQIVDIKQYYHAHFNQSLSKDLEKLATSNKNTYIMKKMFQNLCNTDQRIKQSKFQSDSSINMIEINKHVEWMESTKRFNKNDREKMVNLFTNNSDHYINILCKQYNKKSINKQNIYQYMKSRYGYASKSIDGNYLTIRIKTIKNQLKYYAFYIHNLIDNKDKFKNNFQIIMNIFLTHLQIDLYQIQKQYDMDYADKDLNHFIKENGAKHGSTYFLIKILDNSKRFANVN